MKNLSQEGSSVYGLPNIAGKVLPKRRPEASRPAIRPPGPRKWWHWYRSISSAQALMAHGPPAMICAVVEEAPNLLTDDCVAINVSDLVTTQQYPPLCNCYRHSVWLNTNDPKPRKGPNRPNPHPPKLFPPVALTANPAPCNPLNLTPCFSHRRGFAR